jgi:hypothetical protein
LTIKYFTLFFLASQLERAGHKFKGKARCAQIKAVNESGKKRDLDI